MTNSHPVHTVCPHCKRPVAVLPGQRNALCAEHGSVVPMRSAIVNAPAAPQPLRLAPVV
ncbi:MAG: hypothetical protein RKP20_06990 [Candidatus Competibacter sp.]|nr:hypothetical protein [Candidatus Competibacter sp.]MDS4068529.1 hypothetical protein [Candidatus Competibacter sp.]